jgi:serine/threonine protein kinase
MSLAAGTRFGPYEILAPLGAGGMGEVYRAKDSRLGRDVAIKVLPAGFSSDGERLKRFELEAKATSALNHPNILTVFDIGSHEGAPYLVAELLEGETLREKLTGPLPPRKAVEWAIQMAHGLAAAHEKGIVHRDLKPENLFITKDNRLKILDFGLAKLTGPVAPGAGGDDTPTRSVGTAAGVVMGTVGYMSPEQVRGEVVDARSDLFAFGTILYEMISGKRAFKGNSAVETMNAILKEEPPEFPALDPASPPGLDRLVRHCLEKSPDQRFHSARDLAFQLETLSGISGVNQAVIAASAAPVKQVFRSAILPPDNTKFELDDAHGASLALSPDGRKLVFVAETPDKKKPLWIRSLDSLNAQPLSGTEEAKYPFWSPDSRFIGFVAKGKLKKIEAIGGLAATLCDIQTGYAGSWSVDNRILFIPKFGGLIHQVSASGGVAAPVSQPEGFQPEVPHHWPEFLPDGRHYLCLRRGSDSGGQLAFAIYLVSLDGKTYRFLAESDSRPVYARGHIFYQRGRILIAHPFDLSTLEVTGEPVPIAEPVRIMSDRLLGMFSVSQTGVLAYQAERADHGEECCMVWLDRTGKQTGLLGKPAIYEDIKISPDGKRVAVMIREPDRRASDLWVFDVARGMKTRLTFDSSYKHFVIWSPDSMRIVFTAVKADKVEMHEIPADGSGGAVRIMESKSMLFPCDWSPDGRQLIYSETDQIDRSRWSLLSLPLEGDRKPFPVLQEGFPQPPARFSPDGKWIVYDSGMSGTRDLYVTSFPGPGGKTLIATDGNANGFWRRDGKALIHSQNDQLMETAIDTSGGTLEVGETRALFSGWIKSAREIDVSADGERILLVVTQETLVPDQRPISPQPIVLVVNWDAELKK